MVLSATRHDSFIVRRKALLTVRGASGAERSIRVFGSVLDIDGRAKLFGYVVD